MVSGPEYGDRCIKTAKSEPIETVEDFYSRRIEEARKNVERLCIAKAKAEALNIHKYPYRELLDTLQIW